MSTGRETDAGFFAQATSIGEILRPASRLDERRSHRAKTMAGRGAQGLAMALLRITDRAVEGLVVEDREAIFWDRALLGFGVRVYPSGAKVYVVQTRADGRSRRVTLGRHKELSAVQARRRAALVIARIKAGEEPDPARAAVARDLGPTVSVAELAARYLDRHVAVQCRPSTLASYRSALNKWILPSFGEMPVTEVGREHVLALHDRLRDIPYRANQAIHILSRMFALAESWGLRKQGTHPLAAIAKYEERRRERSLSTEEYGTLGQVLDALEPVAATRGPGSVLSSAVAALRMLMLTGFRRNEVLTLRWTDVNRKAAVLRLRNGGTAARAVPLPPVTASVLNGIRRVPGNPWVLVGARRGRRLANLNEQWLRVRAEARLDDVRLHDLRHSFFARALALGESPAMVGRLLGRAPARDDRLSAEEVLAAASRVADSIARDLGMHAHSRDDEP